MGYNGRPIIILSSNSIIHTFHQLIKVAHIFFVSVKQWAAIEVSSFGNIIKNLKR